MDIQTNIDVLLQADLKDWHHYKNERKIQELRERLEQVQTQITLKEGEKMVEKIKPCTVISKHYNDDGRASWYAIDYSCPTCGRKIRSYKSDNACDECGTFYDWGEREPRIETTRSVVW